jgi:proprotein convertase subtilisin/kexin type 5
MDQSNACHCTSQAYEDVSLGKCLACHYSCSTCDDGDNCSKCKGVRDRPIAEGYCSCPEGYGDHITEDCIKCNEGCINCALKAELCLSCNNNRVLPGCSCPSGIILKFII